MSGHGVLGIPWHPALIAASFVAFNVIDTGVHPAAGGRAMLVALLLVVAVQVVASASLRDRHRGGIVAMAFILVAIFWVPAGAVVDGYLRLAFIQAAILAVLMALAVILAGRLIMRHGLPSGARLTSGFNAFSVALALVVGASAITADGLTVHWGPRPAAAADQTVATDAPDIFVIVMDGHPRADSLLEQTGHDLGEFLGKLEDLGFQISPQARSNYRWTGASLPSLLNMRLVGADSPELVYGQAGTAEMRAAVADNAAFNTLRVHGYQTIAVGPPYEKAALRTADKFHDGGYLNSLECHLIRRTVLGPIAWAISPAIVGDFGRAGVRASLELAAELAATEADQPRFVWVHLPVPHLPILWDADGDRVDDAHGSECAPQGVRVMDAADMRVAYVESLIYADRLVSDAISRILTAADEPPVILLLSDHGGHLVGSAPDHDRPEHWRDSFGTLMAIHAPGEPELLPPDVSLVSVLPRVFNAYLGTDLPLSDDRTFSTDGTEAPEP